MHSRGAILAVAAVSATAYLLSGGAWPASGYETENVFIIVIDGVRNSEAFDDPTHANVPHMWNDLRPLGSIYSNFYNTGTTITTGAHTTILSGVRSGLPHCTARGDEPLVFECYRKDLEAAEEAVWLLDNNPDGFVRMDYSTHPAYGETYRASTYHAYPEPDTHVARTLAQVMDQHHPSLVLVNLWEVDQKGHQEDWEGYLKAIKTADRIVYHLWKKIEADTTFNPAFTDTTYRGKTMLIVTTDHGRRDDLHGGFQKHSLRDRGCRDLIFLALGPDVKADTIIDARGDQIDIGTTAAELLGFSLPLSQGRVLHEMLEAPEGGGRGPHGPRSGEHMRSPDQGGNGGGQRGIDGVRVTDTEAMSRDPAIAATNEGLHLVWAERDTCDASDGWDIHYALSTHGGLTWLEEPAPLRRQGDDTPHTPDIAANDEFGVFVAAAGYDFRPDLPEADSTFVWGVEGRPRYQGGVWGQSTTVTEPKLMHIHGGPAVALSGQRIEALSASSYLRMAWAACESLGADWQRMLVQTGGGKLREHPNIAVVGSTEHALFIARWEEYGVPWYARRAGPGSSLNVFLTDGEGLVHGAALGVDAETLVAVWGDSRQGHWEIYWRKSTDGGSSWGEDAAPLSVSGVGAWLPDVTVAGDMIWVVWEDYRDGNGEIYARRSTDGGLSWSGEMRVSDADGFSVHPRVTHIGNGVFAVWQDDRDGNWEIYASRLLFP